MKYQTLVVEKSTYFLQIEFNRIDKGNAYNQQMLKEFINLFNEIEENREIRLVILRSRGRHFQLGADLDWLFKVSLQDENTNSYENNMDRRDKSFPQSSISKIAGPKAPARAPGSRDPGPGARAPGSPRFLK